MTLSYDIIGFGTYSVVICPSVSRHLVEVKKYENPQKSDVCKIFKSEEDCEEDFYEEINMLEKVSAIPQYTDFTVEFKGASIFDISEINHERRIMRLLIKDDYYSLSKRILSNKKNNFYEITFGYGGVSIDKIPTKIDFASFVHLILQFYKGILNLHTNNIIHRDIKPANVLYDENKLNIIDFGLSCQTDDVYNFEKSFFLLQCVYPFHPPEFLIASKLYNCKLNHQIDEIFTIYTKNNDTLKQYFSLHCYDPRKDNIVTIKSYASAFQEMFDEIKNNKIQEMSQIFTKEMAQKTDVFGSSFVLKSLKYSVIFHNEEQIDFFEKLVQMTCHLNPYKRSNVPDILKFIETFFYS